MECPCWLLELRSLLVKSLFEDEATLLQSYPVRTLLRMFNHSIVHGNRSLIALVSNISASCHQRVTECGYGHSLIKFQSFHPLEIRLKL